MKEHYKNYAALARHEKIGVDYVIESRDRPSPYLIAAPHGGKLEAFTTELARQIAGEDHSFYSFITTKQKGNLLLHITSHQFDEPKALQAVQRADIVIAIHGQGSDFEESVMIGGLHVALRERCASGLDRAGFKCQKPSGGIHGRDPDNICNRGRCGQGIQLEITRRLRFHLRDDDRFRQAFTGAVRDALASYRGKLDR